MATLSPPAEAGAQPPETAAASPASIPVPALVRDANACPSCGAAFAGDYCGACGERRLVPEHFSVRHFFGEISGAVIGLDSRAVRSFRLLFTRPGLLTVEALQGRRKPYVGALKLYLLVFTAIVVLAPLLTRQPEQRAESRDALTGRFGQLLSVIAEHRGLSQLEARRTLSLTMVQHEGWLAVLIPLLFAVVLYAAFRRRRKWFGEHLLFALHYATFSYGLTLLLMLPQFSVFRPGQAVIVAVSIAGMLAQLAYMSIAVRRVYGGGRWAAAGWGVAMMAGFSASQLAIGAVSLGTAIVRLVYF